MEHKITQQQYNQLNNLFQVIDPPAQNYLYATGDHYELFRLLCNLGFRPPKDAIDVYCMAERILLNGFER